MSQESDHSPPVGSTWYLQSFSNLIRFSPDFCIILALDYLSFIEVANVSLYSISSPSSTGLQDHINIAQQQNEQQVEAVPKAQALSDLQPDGFATTEEISDAVQSGIALLTRVLNVCPGMTPAYVELARCNATLGLFEEASRGLQQCLSLQPSNSAVLLALAKVEIGRDKSVSADRVINQALSCDFAIRNVPLFKLVKAIVRAQQGRYDEALAEVEVLCALPEFGFGLDSSHSSDAKSAASLLASVSTLVKVNYNDSLRLTEDDRVGVFVIYSSLLSKLRRLKEANKVLAYAKIVYAGTSQEVQVLVAASQLYVEKNDFESAIRMLDKVPQDSSTYSRAQIIKADIVLNHHHDKERFTKCYQHLAEREPTARHFSLLGEAYLRILNPEAAIDALEKAFRLDPTNGRLRGRIGKALVATHEYHRAIDFYTKAINQAAAPPPDPERSRNRDRERGESKSSLVPVSSSSVLSSSASASAIKTPGLDAFHLSLDLAKLYIKLGRSSSALQVLNDVLHKSPSTLSDSRQNVITLQLLAQVQMANNPDKALMLLLEAYPLQKDVVIQLRSGSGAVVSSSEIIESEKTVLSDICYRIGNVYVELGENRQAEQMHQEAVQFNPGSTKAMLGIAKLLLAKGEKVTALQQCKKIVTADPEYEDAVILLSEVMVTDDESSTTAVEPLLAYLKLKPNAYLAMEKAIVQLRRQGRLEVAIELLEKAEQADKRCVSQAGYHYCHGMYAQFINDVGKAISEFNLSRKDETWGARALTNMIDLYLNPDQEGIWEEKDTGPLDDSTRANIAAAEELLKELRPLSTDPLRVRVLENYCAMATRQKPKMV